MAALRSPSRDNSLARAATAPSSCQPLSPDSIVFGVFPASANASTASDSADHSSTTSRARALQFIGTGPRRGAAASSPPMARPLLNSTAAGRSSQQLQCQPVTSMKCMECGGASAWSWHHCADCSLTLCNGCNADVHARRSFRSHRVTQVDGDPAAGGGTSSAGTDSRVGHASPRRRRSSEMSCASTTASSLSLSECGSPTAAPGSLTSQIRAAARELRKHREGWKSECASVRHLLPILDEEKAALKQEMHEHFRKLHKALDSREATLTRDLDTAHRRRVSPLEKVLEELDAAVADSKRLIRLARASSESSKAEQHQLFADLRAGLHPSSQLDSGSMASLVSQVSRSENHPSFKAMSTTPVVKAEMVAIIGTYGHVSV